VTGGWATPGLPRAELSPRRRVIRYMFSRVLLSVVTRLFFRVRLEGRERLPAGGAMYCFNHLGWFDPIALMAAFPIRARLYFYGPKETDMGIGARNRLISWAGIAVPFRPTKDDLIMSVRRAEAIFDSGAMLAIAGEGQIHVHEGDLMALQEGASYLALRARVPIVPVAITGTSWLGFRRTITVRVGEAIQTGPRPTRDVVKAYTNRTWHALRTMVDADRDLPVPGPFGRWITDLFNTWGPGGRAAASLRYGPNPADVPVGDSSAS
jgi:1-acyl-sn-glycerol-3-phosphate acyltransferase